MRPNEEMQQTKPGITTHGPVFAADLRCWADPSGSGSYGAVVRVPPEGDAGAEPWRCLPVALRLAHSSTVRLHGRPAQHASIIPAPLLVQAGALGTGQAVERRRERAGPWSRAAAGGTSSSPRWAALRAG